VRFTVNTSNNNFTFPFQSLEKKRATNLQWPDNFGRGYAACPPCSLY
jgi:hypothetical protein